MIRRSHNSRKPFRHRLVQQLPLNIHNQDQFLKAPGNIEVLGTYPCQKVKELEAELLRVHVLPLPIDFILSPVLYVRIKLQLDATHGVVLAASRDCISSAGKECDETIYEAVRLARLTQCS